MRTVAPVFALLLLLHSAPAPAEEKVVIGIAANFSGMSDNMWNPYANYFRNGINLALSENQSELKKRGIDLQVKEFDYGNDRVGARKVAIDAAASDVAAVVGYPYSSEVLLAGDVFNEKKLLLLSPSATADRIGKLSRYVRTCSFNDSFQGALLAKAAKERSIRTVAIVSIADCAYCQSLRQAFKAQFAKDEGQVVIDDLILEQDAQLDQVMGKLAGKLREHAADAVFLPNYERVSATIISSLYDRGVRPRIWFGGDGWGTMSDLFLRIVEKRHVEGFALGHWHKNLTTKRSVDFGKKFAGHYGKYPNDIAVVSYDAMRLLLKAILTAEKKDRDGILRAVEHIDRFDGVTGAITFAKGERTPAREAVLLSLKDGKVSLSRRIGQ